MIELLARVARLPEPRTSSVRKVEPVSLNVAYQVRTALVDQNVRSLTLVTPGFRSRRFYLFTGGYSVRLGIATFCVPVCGGWLDKGEPRCIGFAALAVDHAVSKEVLRVVQPAAIDAARLADAEQSRQLDDVAVALHRDLQAVQYTAKRAHKQSMTSIRTTDSSPMNSNGDGSRR
jgi:hypothetical protein